MVMFRGRGARGAGRGASRGGGRGLGGAAPSHMLHGMPPMRMKPGRGLPPRGGPRPPPSFMAPRPRPGPMYGGPYGRPAPPDMMMPMMPRMAPYPPRGAGGPPYRGRGGPARGRGAAPRGRGAATRGRGAAQGAKAAAPAEPQPKPAEKKKTRKPSRVLRNEKNRDASDMLKPWVTDELRAEMKKKHDMHTASNESNTPEHLEAFRKQRSKVAAMIKAAKLEYIGNHEEQDVGKIMAEVGLKQAAKLAEAAAEAGAKTEPKDAENGAASEAPAENGSVADPAAENGAKAEPTAA